MGKKGSVCLALLINAFLCIGMSFPMKPFISFLNQTHHLMTHLQISPLSNRMSLIILLANLSSAHSPNPNPSSINSHAESTTTSSSHTEPTVSGPVSSNSPTFSDFANLESAAHDPGNITETEGPIGQGYLR